MLGVATLLTPSLLDTRRLAITPSWFLVNVDARLMPLYGTALENAVIAELAVRMRKGEVDDDRIASLSGVPPQRSIGLGSAH